MSIALFTGTHNTEYLWLGTHQPNLTAIVGDVLVDYRPEDEKCLIVKSQENVLPLVTGCVDRAMILGAYAFGKKQEEMEAKFYKQ